MCIIKTDKDDLFQMLLQNIFIKFVVGIEKLGALNAKQSAIGIYHQRLYGKHLTYEI